MEYFHLLEVIASEAFSSNAMSQRSRTARYLSALATLSQALARLQQALAEVERLSELMNRDMDDEMQAALAIQRRQAECDRELAELELRGLDLWVNAMSGAFLGKEQISQALKQLSDDVADDAFARIVPSDEELDRLVSGLGACR